MAKQSNLEKIGFERRNEHELLRNDIQKNKPYDENHPYAISREGQPLGKGTESSGHQHSIPMGYSELTKNQIRPQIDVENGGGEYDINGRPGVDGGRKWLMTINTYDKDNKYGVDSIDTEYNVVDGQILIK
jgi:hypothetical protein